MSAPVDGGPAGRGSRPKPLRQWTSWRVHRRAAAATKPAFRNRGPAGDRRAATDPGADRKRTRTVSTIVRQRRTPHPVPRRANTIGREMLDTASPATQKWGPSRKHHCSRTETIRHPGTDAAAPTPRNREGEPSTTVGGAEARHPTGPAIGAGKSTRSRPFPRREWAALATSSPGVQGRRPRGKTAPDQGRGHTDRPTGGRTSTSGPRAPTPAVPRTGSRWRRSPLPRAPTPASRRHHGGTASAAGPDGRPRSGRGETPPARSAATLIPRSGSGGVRPASHAAGRMTSRRRPPLDAGPGAAFRADGQDATLRAGGQ